MAGERQGGNSQQDVSTIERSLGLSFVRGEKYAAKVERSDSLRLRVFLFVIYKHY